MSGYFNNEQDKIVDSIVRYAEENKDKSLDEIVDLTMKAVTVGLRVSAKIWSEK